MSRYAPVVPIQIAEQLQGKSIADDVFGDYHLVLAHDILDKPEDYKRVYGKVRERWPESFIILDNSIVELGHAMELEPLLKAADIVKPDCIVVPDVMGEGAATRAMALKFCEDYNRHFLKIARLGNGSNTAIPLMGVLQGKDVEDCLLTYTSYLSIFHVSHIGVPRVIAQQQGSRMPLMAALSSKYAFRSVHLLGFSDDLLDDVSCTRMPIARGIDSAVPVRAGMKGNSLTLNYKADYGPRGDYWERQISSEAELIDVRFNIESIREWITPNRE